MARTGSEAVIPLEADFSTSPNSNFLRADQMDPEEPSQAHQVPLGHQTVNQAQVQSTDLLAAHDPNPNQAHQDALHRPRSSARMEVQPGLKDHQKEAQA